jgi:hypothetical protein
MNYKQLHRPTARVIRQALGAIRLPGWRRKTYRQVRRTQDLMRLRAPTFMQTDTKDASRSRVQLSHKVSAQPVQFASAGTFFKPEDMIYCNIVIVRYFGN